MFTCEDGFVVVVRTSECREDDFVLPRSSRRGAPPPADHTSVGGVLYRSLKPPAVVHSAPPLHTPLSPCDMTRSRKRTTDRCAMRHIPFLFVTSPL